MSRLKDLTSKRFGRLTVIGRDGNRGRGKAAWLCRCVCGAEKIIRGESLYGGHTKSCGCLQREKTGESARKRRGQNSPNWKGGRYRHHGYMFALALGHHRANNNGYALEHILVWEKANGPLPKGATLHHINGIRDDNRLENLEMWISAHPRGQRVEDMVDFCVAFLRKHKPRDYFLELV